ncbi:hypothetical protein [Nostoc sp. DSM 114161]
MKIHAGICWESAIAFANGDRVLVLCLVSRRDAKCDRICQR